MARNQLVGLFAIESFEASNPRLPCSTEPLDSGESIGAKGAMGVGLAAGFGAMDRGTAGATGFGAAATGAGAALRGAARFALALRRGAARFAALRGAARRLAALRATFLDPLRRAESLLRPLLRCALRRAFFFAAIALTPRSWTAVGRRTR